MKLLKNLREQLERSADPRSHTPLPRLLPRMVDPDFFGSVRPPGSF